MNITGPTGFQIRRSAIQRESVEFVERDGRRLSVKVIILGDILEDQTPGEHSPNCMLIVGVACDDGGNERVVHIRYDSLSQSGKMITRSDFLAAANHVGRAAHPPRLVR